MIKKMKIKKKTLNTIIKSGILLLVLAAASYFIWLIFMSPNRSEADSFSCLKSVHDSLMAEWQEGCKAEGKEIGAEGTCPLSPERAGQLKEKYEKQKEDCVGNDTPDNL